MPKFHSNVNLLKNELQNAKIHNVGTLPTPTASGDYGLIQYRTSDNTIHVWNGTAWQQLSTGAVSDATTSAKGIVKLAQDLGGTADLPTVVQVSGLINGTAATPAIRGASAQNNNTGLYFSNTDELSVSSNGVQTVAFGNLSTVFHQSLEVATRTDTDQNTSGNSSSWGDYVILRGIHGGSTTGTAGNTAAQGGNIRFTTGNGGAATGATGANVGGAGGYLYITTGTGGNVTSATGIPGNGGQIQISGGAGGTGGVGGALRGSVRIQSNGGPTVFAGATATEAQAALAAVTLPATNNLTGGIQFGTDGSKVNLYRSANLTLRTDNVLSVGGAVQGDGTILAGSATGTGAIYAFQGDTDTGMYRSAADTLNFATGGTSRLQLDSTQATFSGPVASSHSGTASSVQFTFGSSNFGWYGTGGNTVGLSFGGTGEYVFTAATLDVTSARIVNLTDPTGAQDAATKAYVDATAQGLDAKHSVRAASTANVTIPPGGTTLTIDGVALANGERVLLKDQTTTNQNGIYVVGGVGSSVTLTRATDADTWNELVSAYVWVEEGTANGDTGWVNTANAGGTLGTTAITFTLFSSASSLIAGAGLTKTGNTIDVATADTSLTIAADAISVNRRTNSGLQVNSGLGIALDGSSLTLTATGIKVTDNTYQGLDATLTALAGLDTTAGMVVQTGTDTFLKRSIAGTSNRISITNPAGTAGDPTIDISSSYVGQTSITTLGTVATGTWQGTAIGVAYGGTGQATAKAGRETGLGAAGYYSATSTTGAGTTLSITQATHGLRSSRGLVVQVQEESTGEVVYPDVTVASNGDVTVTFAVTQGATSWRTTIIG